MIEKLFKRAFTPEVINRDKHRLIHLCNLLTKLRFKSDYFFEIITVETLSKVKDRKIYDEQLFFYVLSFLAKMNANDYFDQLLEKLEQRNAFDKI